MDNDDLPVGRLLSRREALALIGAASAAMLAACGAQPTGSTVATSAASSASANLNAEAVTAVATATTNPGVTATAEAAASAGALPTCVVTPEQTEGPYFADVQLDRADIRSDPGTGVVKEGLPLTLALRVSQISASDCTPLPGAIVEVWHCDAVGVYSAFDSEGTANEKFLRGHQTTDASGLAQFTTIYPGWYRGRAVHIHFKVLTTGANGESYEFTSQMYFDDAISDQVYTQPPYTGHSGQRDTTNATDGIYRNGGDQLMLALTPAAQGYSGALHVGLDLFDTSVGANDSMGAGGPGGAPPNGGPGGRGPGR
jgi:protocatechuate 3,4-dioxygenase beta subunit